MRPLAAVALTLTLAASSFAAKKNLEMFFIDVEGGQATLIVSPSGESMLVDTGWPGFGGRDAERIAAAAKKVRNAWAGSSSLGRKCLPRRAIAQGSTKRQAEA